MLSRNRSYPLSLVLAVIPLVVLMLVYRAIYNYTGYGTAPVELLEKFTKETDHSGNLTPNEIPVVTWQGTKEERLEMLLLGTSITRRSITNAASLPLSKKSFIDTHIVGINAWPLDRYPDFFKLALNEKAFDILIIEFSPHTGSDEHLVFRADSFKGRGWLGTVFDPDLRKIRESIEEIEGKSPQSLSPAQLARRFEKAKNCL